MRIASSGVASTLMIAACLCGMSTMVCAQAPGSRAGNGGLSATAPNVNPTGGGAAAGATLSPTPGLATPGGAIGGGLGTGTRSGTGLGTGLTVNPSRVPNNMRANGTSLNQNPDPRVPSLGGRPAAPR